MPPQLCQFIKEAGNFILRPEVKGVSSSSRLSGSVCRVRMKPRAKAPSAKAQTGARGPHRTGPTGSVRMSRQLRLGRVSNDLRLQTTARTRISQAHRAAELER